MLIENPLVMSKVPVGRPPVSRTMSDYLENTLGDNDHIYVYKKPASQGVCDKYFMCEDEGWCCTDASQRVCVEFENNSPKRIMLVFCEVEIDWSEVCVPNFDDEKQTFSARVEGVGQVMRHTISPHGTATFEFQSSLPFFCTIVVMEEKARIHNANWPIMATLADTPTCNVYLINKGSVPERHNHLGFGSSLSI